MNKIQSTIFAMLMTFSLAFAGQAEAKQHHKNHKHTSHSKHRSSSHGHKQTKQKNGQHHKKQSSTAKKVNKKAVQTFQQKGTQANISPTAIKHIKDRHWHNATQGTNTSHFSRSMTDQKLSKLAAKTINQGSQRASTHGQGRSTYQYRFDKPIGKTTTGQKARALRVVTDAKNNVITAFPVK